MTGSRPPELPVDPPADLGAGPVTDLGAAPATDPGAGPAPSGGSPRHRLVLGDPTALADAYTRYGARLLAVATAAGKSPAQAAAVARAALAQAWEHPLRFPAGDEALAESLAAAAARLAAGPPARSGRQTRPGEPEPSSPDHSRPTRPSAGPAGDGRADPRAALLAAALARRPAVAAAPAYAASFAAWTAAVDRVLAELSTRDWDRPTGRDGRTPREVIARLAGLDAALAGAIGIPVAGALAQPAADPPTLGSPRVDTASAGAAAVVAAPAGDATEPGVASDWDGAAGLADEGGPGDTDAGTGGTGGTGTTGRTGGAGTTGGAGRTGTARGGRTARGGGTAAGVGTDGQPGRTGPGRAVSYWPAVFWPPVFWPPVLLWRTWHEGARGLCAWLAGREPQAARIPVDAFGWTAPVEDHLTSRMLGTWLDGDAIAATVGVRLPPLDPAELRAALALALDRIRWRPSPEAGPADGPFALTLTAGVPAGSGAAGAATAPAPAGRGGEVVGRWLIGPGRPTLVAADPAADPPLVAEIRLAAVDFCLLAVGRRTPAETAAVTTTLSGHPAAGRALLAGAGGVLPA